MSRNDISKHLVHWVKADTEVEAFETLLEIVYDWSLLGNIGHIRGEYNCVCFSEAPVKSFHGIEGRYKPFGVLLSKEFVYASGGRPVIYQSDNEYELLPESHRWRHVRYEPLANPPIDFTWEREWRVQTDEFHLPPEEVIVLVPNQSWIDEIEQHQYDRERNRIYADTIGYGDFAALQTPRDFHYRVCAIYV